MHFFFEDSYNASFDLPARCLHEESKDFLQSLQKGLHGAHPRIGVLFFTTRSQARWRARRDTEACRPGRECREPPKAPPPIAASPSIQPPKCGSKPDGVRQSGYLRGSPNPSAVMLAPRSFVFSVVQYIGCVPWGYRRTYTDSGMRPAPLFLPAST